jgi:predicted glycosyltransferase
MSGRGEHAASTPTTRTRPIRAWIDLVSPSHPFFFAALAEQLDGVSVATTVREKTETVSLAREVGFNHRVVGRDFDNSLIRKAGIPLRTAQLAIEAPDCDVSLSSRNAMCVLASKARGIPSIHFTDNDITAHIDGLWAEELYNRFEAAATHNIVPEAFAAEELTRWGAAGDSIHTYDGYKEDVYVANFEPNPDFPERLPFASGEYIVVRPEALTAAYVDADSIVPALLAAAVERDIGVVYLPRGRGDEVHAQEYPESAVFVPDGAVNGLQLAWHARCVLTGSGTMSREAACMEKPAVSFFPNTLLSVDQELVANGRIFHSRNPEEIIEHIATLDGGDVAPDRERARAVRDEVVELTNELIQSCCGER